MIRIGKPKRDFAARRRRVGVWLTCAGIGVTLSAVGGCAEPAAVDPVVNGTVGAAPVAGAPSSEAPPPSEPTTSKPSDIPGEVDDLGEVGADRWLRVESLRDGVEGGWATGRFIGESNKLVIETEGVARFALALDRVEIDWTRRVVLRIDGSNSELTRKHFPTIRLERSPAGNWVPSKGGPGD